MFGSGFHGHWEEPEPLQEEIVRISQQLPNVQWDKIDLTGLILDASLKGPWGTEGETIYIKVKVAFTYLLGETDLSSSTNFFKNVKDLDDELDPLADESSSEDEADEIPAGGSASMSQELTASVELDATLAPERPKGEPTFAGFGRLQQETPPPRQRHLLDESSMVGDHSDSEDADDSSSSSDSEETYMHKVSMWYTPGRRLRKTFSGSYSMRSSGGGTGVETGTGTGTSRRRSTKPKNVISLHDMSDLLPSKQELAQEYSIFGDGPRDIPLELLEQTPRNSSVLVVAKNIVSHIRDGKTSPGSSENQLAGKVKWGLHPLAKEFITDLFNYFERAADVQMLAMLSCVFSEASTEDGVAYAESHMTQPETPLGMKAPHVNSGVPTPGTIHTPVHIPGSYGSEGRVLARRSGVKLLSTWGTPPPKTTPRDSMSDADVTQSLSTSPEPRLFRRANTALSTGFASSFPRPFTNTVSSSPPTKKRPSPGEAILANLTPNVTWGGSMILGPTSEPALTTRNSYSDDEQRKDDIPLSVINSISVEIEDQSIFDDDG
ncbi:WD repeat-containing protein [Apiospora phragmitis]|uniref:WD repeat-containing protein n=1 Tax=Apiospora phragmitis TaxID=2905665 RepID=A0ABR1VTZ8_9PEZI